MKFIFYGSERWENYPKFQDYIKQYCWKFLGKFYFLIRPLFVDDVDHNEDYDCGLCGKPVLRRYLFCSEECLRRDEALQENNGVK